MHLPACHTLEFQQFGTVDGKVHVGLGAVGEYLHRTLHLSRGRFQAYILPLRESISFSIIRTEFVSDCEAMQVEELHK